jgi:small subunit ribosomal protein S17
MAEKDQEQQPQTASEPEAPVAPVPDEETEEQPAGSEPVDLPAAEPVEEDTAEAVVAEETALAEAEPAPDVEAVAAEAEAPAAEAPAAEAPAAEPAGPKPKRKRVPRAQRPARTKPKREKPKTRKPIVRLPKPEAERGRRQERRGVVVSSAMDKTIVVKVDTIKAHPRYKKVVRRSTKLHAHDEANQAKVGDVVRVVETRPLSKTKHWRLAEVVEAAR